MPRYTLHLTHSCLTHGHASRESRQTRKRELVLALGRGARRGSQACGGVDQRRAALRVIPRPSSLAARGLLISSLLDPDGACAVSPVLPNNDEASLARPALTDQRGRSIDALVLSPAASFTAILLIGQSPHPPARSWAIQLHALVRLLVHGKSNYMPSSASSFMGNPITCPHPPPRSWAGGRRQPTRRVRRRTARGRPALGRGWRPRRRAPPSRRCRRLSKRSQWQARRPARHPPPRRRRGFGRPRERWRPRASRCTAG